MLADMMGFLAPQGAELQPDFMADPDLDLDCIGVTASPPPPFGGSEIGEIIKKVESFKKRLQENSLQKVTFVRTREDLMGHGLKVVLCLQHPPTDSVHGLAESGVLMSGLAYAGENQYGSGFANPNGHLTDAGTRLIEDMARVGMVLDLAHAGERTAHDALDYIEKYTVPIRVVVSHTGCSSVFPHPRNMSDDLLRRVAYHQGGSLVGIYSLTFALDGAEDGPEAFVRHVNHAVEVCGEDHVAIGSDGIYQKRDLEEWQAHTQKMIESLGSKASVFSPRFPDQPLEFNSTQKIKSVAEELSARTSMGTDTIRKVCGVNYLNFLKRILP